MDRDEDSHYQRALRKAREAIERRDGAKEKPEPRVAAFVTDYLTGMITRLAEELKQQKEENAALMERVERLEAKLNQ